jgi:hypothetical protein
MQLTQLPVTLLPWRVDLYRRRGSSAVHFLLAYSLSLRTRIAEGEAVAVDFYRLVRFYELDEQFRALRKLHQHLLLAKAAERFPEALIQRQILLASLEPKCVDHTTVTLLRKPARGRLYDGDSLQVRLEPSGHFAWFYTSGLPGERAEVVRNRYQEWCDADPDAEALRLGQARLLPAAWRTAFV